MTAIKIDKRFRTVDFKDYPGGMRPLRICSEIVNKKEYLNQLKFFGNLQISPKGWDF